MKKTTLFSLCLAFASTSLTFGASAEKTYKIPFFNASSHDIEAIETFIPEGVIAGPWSGIVTGIMPGREQLVTVDNNTTRFPLIQVGSKIYEINRLPFKGVKVGGKIYEMKDDPMMLNRHAFAINHGVRFYDDNNGKLAAEMYDPYYTKRSIEKLSISPIFDGNYLEHSNSLPSTVVPIPQTSIEQYAKALASSKAQ